MEAGGAGEAFLTESDKWRGRGGRGGGDLEGLGTAATDISNRMVPRRVFTSREIQRFTVENDVITDLILVTKVGMMVHVMSVMWHFAKCWIFYVFLMSWLEGTRRSLSDWGETQRQRSQAHPAGARPLSFLQAGSQIIENLRIWLTPWKDEIRELHFLLWKTELFLSSSIYSATDSQVSQVRVPVKDRPVAQAFPQPPLVGEAPFRGMGVGCRWEGNRHLCFSIFLSVTKSQVTNERTILPQFFMSCLPQRQVFIMSG